MECKTKLRVSFIRHREEERQHGRRRTSGTSPRRLHKRDAKPVPEFSRKDEKDEGRRNYVVPIVNTLLHGS